MDGTSPLRTRLLDAARRLAGARATPMADRTRRILLAVAVTLFCGLAVWAWLHRPAEGDRVRWGLYAAAFPLAGVSLALKTTEYRLAARLLGLRPGIVASLQVSVLSAAANLLPIPGSALVTVRSLSEGGRTYGAAATSTAGIGIAWMGCTFLYGGIGLIVAGGPVWLGAAITTAGAGALAASWTVVATQAKGAPVAGTWARIVVVETAFIANATVRILLVLTALRVDADAAQAVALTIATTMANAISFLPGGLGIREGITAAISPIVDLPAEAGLLAAVMDRLLWLTTLGVASIVVLARVRKLEAGEPRPTEVGRP